MPLFFRSKSDRSPSRDAKATPERNSPTVDPGRGVPPRDPRTEAAIEAFGRTFLERARGGRSGMLSRAFWSDKLMDWAMQDEAFKVQLFRFVDAFPMLRTPEQVHEHLVDYLSQPDVSPPPGMDLAIRAGGVAKSMFAKTMASQITGMAEKFIAGTDARDALPVLEKLWKRGLAFSVDLLVEACVSDAEADAYRAKYMDHIENLPDAVNGWPANERLERDHIGVVPRTNVSIKISSLYARTDAIDTEGSIRGLMEALRPLLTRAGEKGVLVNFDMEQFALKDLTLELFMRCCEEFDFTAGIAMQAYLRSGDDDAARIIEWSRRTGRQITVRLVKGAYWDYETIHAEEMGWPIPVWSRKCDSDACFERMADAFIASTPHTPDVGGVKLALGVTTPARSRRAMAALEREDPPGTDSDLRDGPAEAGGDVDGIPRSRIRPGRRVDPRHSVLVRRLLEHVKQSWLRAGFMDDADEATLLHRPTGSSNGTPVSIGSRGGGTTSTFDRRSGGRGRQTVLHRAVPRQRQGRAGGLRPRVAGSGFPGRRRRHESDADEAISIAHSVPRLARHAGAGSVGDPGQGRVDHATSPGRALGRGRSGERQDLAEADGDVCEAIDFWSTTREAVPLFEPRRLGTFVGELDEVLHQPRGVAVVISPWNFPLAICTGMTVAALVCGNTCVVKPAEQTPGIAKIMHDILLEAGCPPEVCRFLPGPGESVGARLVRDPPPP